MNGSSDQSQTVESELPPQAVLFVFELLPCTNDHLFTPTSQQGEQPNPEVVLLSRLILERIRPIAFTLSAETKRAVLLHFLRDQCLSFDFPDSWEAAKYPTSPGRSATKRLRLIRKELRQDPEHAQLAHLCASLYELLDQLSIDDGYAIRDSMHALSRRHELIDFMHRRHINRTSFTDEVLRVTWLRHSERFRALRNRHWFLKRKARFQANQAAAS